MFHKRPSSPLHMPYDEYALGYLKFSFKNTKRVRFGMTIPNTLITEDIRTASYYPEYVAKVAKYQRFLAGEEGIQEENTSVEELSSQIEGVPATEPRDDDENSYRAKISGTKSYEDVLTCSSGDHYLLGRKQSCGKFYSPSDSKERTLLNSSSFRGALLPQQNPLGLVESSSLYAELGLTDSGTESDEEVSPEMNVQGQEEGQGGTNPGDTGVSQTSSSHVVHVDQPRSMELGIA
ncbi:hypothetical protein Tco_0218901 [Tanacetum coccineum]